MHLPAKSFSGLRKSVVKNQKLSKGGMKGGYKNMGKTNRLQNHVKVLKLSTLISKSRSEK